jgi:flagellar motility protein MotE (MotC chaperone)
MARPSMRLLPVTIAVMSVLLADKCVELGRALLPGGLLAEAMVSAAQAATAVAPAPAAPLPPPPAAIPVSAPAPPPPPPVSAAEMQLLQDLRGRRAQLDQRERALSERESVLNAAEHRLTSRVADLAALQQRLEQMEADRRAHEEANWAGIVKVYEAMKPREAAAIFNDMDMPVLLQVMDRMKDSNAALVLGAMQPDRARSLTAQLAAMRTRAITVPPAPASGG